MSTGEDTARTNPMTRAATMVPLIEPMVPSTMTAKAGSSKVKPVCGEKVTYNPKTVPPTPVMPADRKALIICTRSTLIPQEAASSGLSATARMRRPSRVRVSSSRSMMTVPNVTMGMMALLNA